VYPVPSKIFWYYRSYSTDTDGIVFFLIPCINSLFNNYFLCYAAEHYSEQTTTTDKDEESRSSSSFVSPACVSLPMAKLIPILTTLLTDGQEKEEEEWLIHLIGTVYAISLYFSTVFKD
jgi:hypothetical protein